MAHRVPLDDVANELDGLSHGMRAFIHRHTGELITLTEPELAWIEEGDEAETLDMDLDMDLDLDAEMRAKLRDIAGSDQWVMLPDSFEIHEWQIMRDFADTVTDETVQNEILRAIQGQGAFRYFKDTVYRHGIQDEWFDFKREALKDIAREALEEAEIPYRER
jgi:uncharacterized protein UPF0158